MRSLGLRATELGPEGFLPRGSERALLETNGLSLVAGFVPVVLHDPSSLERELATVDAAADTISALGGRVLVLAASTGKEGYEETGRLDTAGWAALGRGIDRAMASAGERGLLVALHPHHGTVVERPEDVERVLDVSGVGVCLDTGHVMVSGGDPVALARTAGSRVTHVHLKDADATIAERVAAGDLGYHAAVAAGLYRPLGEGDVDVRAVLRTVEESGDAVWYVLEHDEVLDHEPEPGSGPLPNARRSLAFLERAWEEVGSTTGR
jgi:inosose dehydratase